MFWDFGIMLKRFFKAKSFVFHIPNVRLVLKIMISGPPPPQTSHFLHVCIACVQCICVVHKDIAHLNCVSLLHIATSSGHMFTAYPVDTASNNCISLSCIVIEHINGNWFGIQQVAKALRKHVSETGFVDVFAWHCTSLLKNTCIRYLIIHLLKNTYLYCMPYLR